MADYNLAAMTLVIPYLLQRRTQIGRKAPLFSRLRKRPGAGKIASDVIETGGATVSNIAEGANAPTATVNAETAYSLGFGTYTSTLTITEQARRASGTVNGPPTGTGGYNDRLWEEGATRIVQIVEKIEGDLWTGTGTNEIVGFDLAIGDTTNTYAGINRATPGNEYWHPNVFDDGVPTAATRALIESDLTEIRSNVYHPGSPDLIVASPGIFNAVKASMQGNVAYNIGAFPVGGVPQVGLQASADALYFGSAVMFVDDYAPTDSITYLNSEHVWIEYMPYPPDARRMLEMMTDPGMMAKVRMAMMEAGLSDQLLPLDMYAQKLGAVGAAESLQYACFPSLVVARPNACGMRLNIAV
jgi:hypothetical protein